jgi:hypothetical protein
MLKKVVIGFIVAVVLFLGAAFIDGVFIRN